MSDRLRYDGKTVLVIGAATGMGAAVAQGATALGAKVIALDVANVTFPVDQSIQIDLRNRDNVDSAIGQLTGSIDAVFACAGVADGTPGIMLINFTAQRYLIEQLIVRGTLGRGSAVSMISSVAGLGWMQNIAQVQDFLANTEWDTMAKWVADHDGTDAYSFSKQAINCYVAQSSFSMLQQGMRINAILPGPTDTPLARANADMWLGFGSDYRAAAGVDTLVPQQMADVMLFLCSDAASGVNGVSLLVDQGHVNAAITDRKSVV